MDVAVRELKAKLSSYLQRAAAGEILTVTDRGRPIAQIRPLPGQVDLEVAANAGWLTLAKSPGLTPIVRQKADRSIREVLDDDRAQ